MNDKKAKDYLLMQIDIKKRIKYINGKNFWSGLHNDKLGIKKLRFSDGPHGLRISKMYGHSKKATCFPCACLSACSFNDALIYELGKGIASEAIINNVNVVLGPGINLKRHPFGGRNFEYFSEDPILSGRLGSAYVNGVQSLGVGACVKHYVLNNLELNRMIVDEVIDEETLINLYIKPFEIVIKESSPRFIMFAYNKVNGEHIGENHYLINTILKNRLKYDGMIISDWGAFHDIVKTIKCGVNLLMPHVRGLNRYIYHQYLKGLINDVDINSCLRQRLNLDLTPSKISLSKKDIYHHNYQTALKIASESIVLLKNDGILPLTNQKVVVIGQNKVKIQGCGSSYVKPYFKFDFLYFLKQANIPFCNYDGYDLNNYKRHDKLIKQIKENIKPDDIVILFIQLPDVETEGVDLQNNKLPLQEIELIDVLHQLSSNLILIINSGNPIEMPFVDKCNAILYAGLGGEAVAEALKNILFGIISPSGKLAQTFPVHANDILADKYIPKNDDMITYYRERFLIGYRDYLFNKKQPLFCFGYGLSYTKFTFSNLVVSKNDEGLIINLNVKNVGNYPGKEVVQVYIKSVFPFLELKAYEKINLKVGESKNVSIFVYYCNLKYFYKRLNRDVLIDGDYQIFVGNSVDNTPLRETIHINGEKIDKPILMYDFYADQKIKFKEQRYDLDTRIYDMNKKIFIIEIIKFCINLYLQIELLRKNPNYKMLETTLKNAPIRNITMAGFSYQTVLNIIKKSNKNR